MVAHRRRVLAAWLAAMAAWPARGGGAEPPATPASGAAAAADVVPVVTTIQPPYTYQDGDRPAGLFIDVMAAVSRLTGLEFRYTYLPWKRAQALAMEGGRQVIIPLARSPEREPSYAWIAPVVSFDTVLFVHRRAPPTLEDARAMTLGIMFSTTFEKEVVAARLEHVERVPDELTNARKLHQGHIDGWVTTDRMAPGVWKEAGFDPAELVAGPHLGPTKTLYIAASRDLPPDVARRIAEACERLRRDGVIDEIIRRR